MAINFEEIWSFEIKESEIFQQLIKVVACKSTKIVASF